MTRKRKKLVGITLGGALFMSMVAGGSAAFADQKGNGGGTNDVDVEAGTYSSMAACEREGEKRLKREARRGFVIPDFTGYHCDNHLFFFTLWLEP